MKKDERIIKQLFIDDAMHQYVSDNIKTQAVDKLLSQAKVTAKEKSSLYNTNKNRTITANLVFSQISMHYKYMDKKLYIMQVIIVLVCIFFNINVLDKSSVLFEEQVYTNVVVSSVIFSTISIIASNIYDRHKMAELAGSCFFNQKQVCVFRMALSGAVSLAALGLLLCVVYKYIGSAIYVTGIYILVPYFVTGCVQFVLIRIEILGRSQYILWIGGVVTAVIFRTIALNKKIYNQEAVKIWFLAMVLSGIVMIYELCNLLRKIEKGDLLCMS